ncbi:hypothetical protein EVAR_97716_1 [Eumeta japonica]|uniref:Uncharacterized protein n=1 Tax=Eumeta variegata TaxID=151549 RepID=A0A4C1XYZ7_EUMVA|nr:hypothetical protein EVAR_97716_1 [Eumeta japonica]
MQEMASGAEAEARKSEDDQKETLGLLGPGVAAVRKQWKVALYKFSIVTGRPTGRPLYEKVKPVGATPH